MYFFGSVILYGADLLLFKRSPPLRIIYIAYGDGDIHARWAR